MSETGKFVPEEVVYKSSKMYSPEEFDHKVKTDPTFKDRIAGATTIGFEHFKKGISDQGLSILPYGNNEAIYCVLARSTYESMFGDTRNYLYEDDAELLEENRAYGGHAAVAEALTTHSSLSFDEVMGVGLDINNDGLRAFFLKSEKGEEEKMNGWADYEDEQVEDAAERMGIKDSSFAGVGKMMRERAGVQVVYEKSDEFLRFLKDNDIQLDPYADQAAVLYGPIPSEFILAVVPLGGYEQQSLQKVMER